MYMYIVYHSLLQHIYSIGTQSLPLSRSSLGMFASSSSRTYMVAPPLPILAPGGSENTRYLRRWKSRSIHSTGSYDSALLLSTIVVLTMEVGLKLVWFTDLTQHVYHLHHNAYDTESNPHWGLVWGLGSRLV